MARDLNDYLGTTQAADFGDKVVERFRRWRIALERNGLLETWRRNYRQYFNGPVAPGSSDQGWGWTDSFQILGESGEILNIRMAEARNLIKHMANLACAKPSALRSVATSSKPDALEAADIADSVIRQDFDPTAGGQLVRECVELALAVTGAFLDAEWDVFAGEAYIPTDDGSPWYAGEPKLSVRYPDEVAMDLTKRRFEDVDDAIVMQRANRYMIATQFGFDTNPETGQLEQNDLHDKIMGVPNLHDSEFKPFRYDDEDSADVIIFRYMHRAGNARFLPQGRLALVLEDGTVLRDGPNPYSLVDPKRLSLFPIIAGNGLGSIYGYAVMNDLSPLSQWLNLMATMAATLIAGYGAPNLSGPNMMSLQVQHMVGGGRYFGVPANQGEIKPLNLLDEGALGALLKLMEFVIGVGEKHSGINGVVRGETGDQSGKFVAMVKSLAVQFMNDLQQSIIATEEALGNFLIRLRQKYSTSEQIAELGSASGNAQQVKSYMAADTFALVAKVKAEAVDPLSQTPEGRELRADKMREIGAFNGPTGLQDYLLLLKTGRDEPMFKAPMATAFLIQRENQMLMQGKPPTVIAGPGNIGDAHDLHIPEHMACLADPESRDPSSPVAQAVFEHVARHLMAKMGVPFQQGVNPQTQQPFPPAIQQFEQALQQQQQQQQQQAIAQAQLEAMAHGQTEPKPTPPGGPVQGPPQQPGQHPAHASAAKGKPQPPQGAAQGQRPPPFSDALSAAQQAAQGPT